MKKLFKNFSFVGMLMLVLSAVLGIVDVSAVLAAPTVVQTKGESGKGVVMSGGPQTIDTKAQGLDTTTTNAQAPDLLMDTVSQEIVKIRPGYTPLDTIMRHAKNKPANSWKYAWWSADIRPVSSKVTALTNSGNNGVVTVEDATLFNLSDTIRLADIEGKLGDDKVYYIYDIDNSKNTLSVTYADENGATTAPTISMTSTGFESAENFIFAFRLGRAAGEADVKTINYSALPTRESNYCQIFKWQVAETTYQKLAKKEVDWDMSDVEEQATVEFKMAQEASFLFGRKAKYYNPKTKEEIYATGGLVHYINKDFVFDTAKGADEFIDLCEMVFQGNTGNRKRVMFMGSGFNKAISKIDLNNKQIQATETRVVWGLEFNEIKTNFGTLMCLQHDLFDSYGYKDKAIILDVDNIDKFNWLTESLDLDTKKTGEFNGDVHVYTETCGVALRYPDTHCIVSLGKKA